MNNLFPESISTRLVFLARKHSFFVFIVLTKLQPRLPEFIFSVKMNEKVFDDVPFMRIQNLFAGKFHMNTSTSMVFRFKIICKLLHFQNDLVYTGVFKIKHFACDRDFSL